MSKNLISYSQFFTDRYNFRKSGEDIFDLPGHSFFKIMFHFYNGDSEYSNNHCGLLAPTWENQIAENEYYNYDSAWAYLKNNYEDERAYKLQKFIELLSSISSEYPWYFQEITGLEEALNRNQVNEFKFEDQRKKIDIKCLPDSYDQKIGTLLSLYREIVWSWTMKREVLPANLRKFDMSLFIWESPVYGLHRGNGNTILDNESTNTYSASYKLLEFHNCEIDYNSIKTGYSSINNKEGIQNEYTISISFDDCYEQTYNHVFMNTIGDMVAWDMVQVLLDDSGNSSINYNWDDNEMQSINNKREIELKNRLNLKRRINWYLEQFGGNIEYNTEVQTGVNEFGDPIMSKIPSIENDKILLGYKGSSNNKLGDLIMSKISSIENDKILSGYKGSSNNESEDLIISKISSIENDKILSGYKGSSNNESGFLRNVTGSVITNAVDEIKTIGNRLLLGNLYTYSISKMASQFDNIMKGNPSAALSAIDNYAGTNIMNQIHNNSLNNLAGRLQGKLNNIVNDRRENSSNTQLGSMPRGVEEPKPAAAKPYSNSVYDRSEPATTLSNDIFPPDTSTQQHVPRDIFPPDTSTQQHVPRDIFPPDTSTQQHVPRDIFPPDTSTQQHVPRDIFPPVKAGARVTSLGNLNSSKTLINNI